MGGVSGCGHFPETDIAKIGAKPKTETRCRAASIICPAQELLRGAPKAWRVGRGFWSGVLSFTQRAPEGKTKWRLVVITLPRSPINRKTRRRGYTPQAATGHGEPFKGRDGVSERRRKASEVGGGELRKTKRKKKIKSY